MLNLAKSRMTLREGVSGERSYELVVDTEAENPEIRIFRRIAGGAAWPAGGKPGYVAAVGEDANFDFEYDARHLYRVYETGDWMGRPMMTWEDMFEAMHFLSSRFGVTPWYCLPCPSWEALTEYNRKAAGLKKTPLKLRHLREPELERFLTPVWRRTTSVKTLHFGTSEMAARLARLPSNVSGEKFEDHPQVAALVMAVNGLEHTRPQAPSRQTGRAADRIGGY